MKKIVIERSEHRGQKVLKLVFPFDSVLAGILKTCAEARWSATHRCWHVPDKPGMLNKLLTIFNGKAWLDYTALNGKKPQVKENAINNKEEVLPSGSPDMAHADAFVKWMEHRRYSSSTIKTYTGALQVFVRFLGNKPVKEADNSDVVRFTNEYILAKGLSSSYQNQAINALKLFFKHVLNSEIKTDQIERPRRDHRLPNVLSKEEVKAILQAPANIKHKAMLSLIYACGLRRSELLNLKPEHVDSKRGLLIIKQAKGRKDRVAPLSGKLVETLREYYRTFRPKVWLFEGQVKGEKYSDRSLEMVLKHALKKTKIKKPVSLHWLRHSYATHLLEGGTDLRYIQEILGHKSSKTTEIYTHVTTKSIQKIKSPFDDL